MPISQLWKALRGEFPREPQWTEAALRFHMRFMGHQDLIFPSPYLYVAQEKSVGLEGNTVWSPSSSGREGRVTDIWGGWREYKDSQANNTLYSKQRLVGRQTPVGTRAPLKPHRPTDRLVKPQAKAPDLKAVLHIFPNSRVHGPTFNPGYTYRQVDYKCFNLNAPF